MEKISPSESAPLPAVEFCCARCSKRVVICRSCWRNQKYCSLECSEAAYLDRRRENQRNYYQTEASSELRGSRLVQLAGAFWGGKVYKWKVNNESRILTSVVRDRAGNSLRIGLRFLDRFGFERNFRFKIRPSTRWPVLHEAGILGHDLRHAQTVPLNCSHEMEI